jgi:hypothetical protein
MARCNKPVLTGSGLAAMMRICLGGIRPICGRRSIRCASMDSRRNPWLLCGLFICVLALAGCTGGYTEVGGFSIYHGYDFETEPIQGRIHGVTYPVIQQCCRETFWGLDLPVESDVEGVIRSSAVEKRGLIFRLQADLTQNNGTVQISVLMKFRRKTDYTSNHTEKMIDRALNQDPEERLDDLEKDHRKGEIDGLRYLEERDHLEKEIQARKSKWKAQERIRIQRITQRMDAFMPILRTCLENAGGRLESEPVR